MANDKEKYIVFKDAVGEYNYIKETTVSKINPFNICIERSNGIEKNGRIEICDESHYKYAIKEKYKGSNVIPIGSLYILKLLPTCWFVFKKEWQATDAKDKFLSEYFYINTI